MRKLLLKWLINAVALFVAVRIVPGIDVDGSGWVVYAVAAIIFGLINTLIRPLLKLLTCPLIILTLGFFTLIINASMLWLTSLIGRAVGYGFYVHGFWPAFWGGVVVSLVSVVLNLIVREEEGRDERRRQWD